MADTKISQLPAVTGANMQDDDKLVVARAAGELNFSVTRDELFKDAPDLSVETVQVTNIQAQDGTASATIADSTGTMTITTVDINGGTIDGAVVDGRDVGVDGAKLDGIEVNADVTDTANVTAAGALMDSELTDEAAVKALDQGVSTTDDPTFTNTQLAAIAETKAVTAVDVFVYDTSKDSDGGAWRKRTQGTSWYNETLNTATRGSRREFPAVAVIVAEAAKVTIYDGDDPALPMWMVFNASTANNTYTATAIFGHTGAPITSVSAINGEVVVGCSAVASNLGVRAANFVSDTAWYKRQIYDMSWLLTIADRNLNDGTVKWTSVGSQYIVNNSVNDVAMTVLPDAPIDPATGLPVPTIAVATGGGVSVIKDDGTVVDLTYTRGNASSLDVFFPEEGGISWTSRVVGVETVYLYWEKGIPTVDKSTAPDLEQGVFTQSPATFSPILLSSGSQGLRVANKLAAGSTGGLTTISRNPQTPKGSMVAYTTSTYNTGWMPGDTKGAFLSDTDDTDLVGSGELVTNGTFDTDTSGWTDASDGRSTASFASGKFRITNDTAGYGYAYQTLSLTVGKTYTVSWDVSAVGTLPPTRVFWGNAEGTTSGGGASTAAAVTGTQSITFVAQVATTYFSVQLFSPNVGPTVQVDFDNVSVQLADEDRSVNNKGLIVNGTVTRDPVATGADLVAYSGFSSSNYLEQPYNSDLDFGTGDFSFMGWVKPSTNLAANVILHRSLPGSAGGVLIKSSATGAIEVYLNNTTSFTLDLTSSVAMSTGVYNNVAVTRKSGVLECWVNGVLAGTAANTDDVSYTDAVLRVGTRNDTPSATTHAIALLRISATAPSAEQIAKIYNDEKVLFQENAQATLYGTSDAVTALAHDDATNLLHVGTSAGRSVFQGLRRVSNTTTAVGTAISASNGLVVEE